MKDELITVEHIKDSDNYSNFIDNKFNEFAGQNNLVCNYTPFAFVAKKGDEIVGLINGHAYYKEVHISDFIVVEKYRHNGIGSKLIQTVEKHFENKEFENINLSTYEFQAPAFYKKHGYTLEFIRESKTEPKLAKYYFVKEL